MGTLKRRIIEAEEPKEEPPMGAMKDLLITIYNGGDEAVAAVQRIGEDWRLQLEAAAGEVERLRLTDAERGAIEAAIAYMAPVANYNSTARDTLRGLLERTAGH